MTLEQVLADFREEAAILRANSQGAQAASIERVCEVVRNCMASYLDWMSEDEARLWSGWSRTRLRAHFPQWETQGLAEWVGEGRKARRRYRRQAVPRRANTLGAFEAGKQSA